MNLIPQDIYAQLTFYPLLACSLAALAIILERGWVLGRLARLSAAETARLAQGPAAEHAANLCHKSLFFQAPLRALVAHAKADKALRDSAVSVALEALSAQLKRRLSALTTLAALAPMLGLLGTIIGLMRAFYAIGRHSGPIEPALMANGLWQAMTTTAAGMVIAIFCTLVHAVFTSRWRRDLAHATWVLNHLSLGLTPAAPQCANALLNAIKNKGAA
ncbi:MAG: MotA/TolQ/ExbB proton channel family protein [Aeromonas sp.]